LLARARLGEEDAFSELYALHIGAVQAMGRAMLHRSDVDDMCQDTFLLAFTRLEKFKGQCTFRTWITRIAMNQCLMALRARRQVSNGDAHLVPLESEDLTARADARLQGVARRLDMDRLMQLLPADERRLLNLAYVDELSLPEVAELVGIPLNCVRRKLYGALREMRRNK
jgi:RNA polymerase sigma-70 factor, ECF subfamily